MPLRNGDMYYQAMQFDHMRLGWEIYNTISATAHVLSQQFHTVSGKEFAFLSV
jgi:hypothetical protein